MGRRLRGSERRPLFLGMPLRNRPASAPFGAPSLLALLLCASLGPLSKPLLAQARDGVVLGVVIDTLNRPVAGVRLEVDPANATSSDHEVRSSDNGTFFLKLVAGGPYTVAAKKIGYGPAIWKDVRIKAGDTLRVTFKLPPIVTTLGTVTVKKGAGSALTRRSIRAGEFNPKWLYSAAQIISRYRPRMFDSERCRFDRTPMRLYINGVRRDRYGESVLEPLNWIDAKEVEHMYFADCMDETVPFTQRPALYVTLKQRPLTAKEEKKLKEIMKKDSQ